MTVKGSSLFTARSVTIKYSYTNKALFLVWWQPNSPFLISVIFFIFTLVLCMSLLWCYKIIGVTKNGFPFHGEIKRKPMKKENNLIFLIQAMDWDWYTRNIVKVK